MPPEVTFPFELNKEMVRCCGGVELDGDPVGDALCDALADALVEGHAEGDWDGLEVGDPEGHVAPPLGDADELADALALALVDAEALADADDDADALALPLAVGGGVGQAGSGKMPHVGCIAGASARTAWLANAETAGFIAARRMAHEISATRAARLCMPLLRKLKPESAMDVKVTSYKSPVSRAPSK